MKKRIISTELITLFLLLIFFSQLSATYQKVGSYCISEDVYSIEYYMKKNDTFLCISCEETFYTVDISNPLEPFLTGSCEIPNEVVSVDVFETLACITTQEVPYPFFMGLYIIDISDPYNPEIVGSYDQMDCGNDVAISGSYVYVADGDSGLQILDISNPENPLMIANYDTPGYAFSLTFSGSLVYIADGDYGLQIIDVTDPYNPIFLGSYTTSGYAYSIAVSDSIAFIGAGYEGLQIIDASNPENPVFLNNMELGQWAERISLSESKIFVFNQFEEMRVVDITNPEEPFILGAYPSRSALGYSDNLAYSVALSIPNFDLYLEILDISNPFNPCLIGGLETEGFAVSLDISGTTAYVTNSESGLKIIDISDPANPTLLATYSIPQYSWARSVAVIGTTVYLVTGQDLLVIDVSDPFSPSLLMSYDTPYSSTDICISDSIAYLSNAFLEIFDISDPHNPILICIFDTPGGANNVTISNSIAHISNWSIGYSIVDVSDPQNPELLGHYDTYQDAIVFSVVDYGSVAYLPVSHSLRIMDISDNQNLELYGVIEPHQDSKIRAKPLILDTKLMLSDNGWCEYLSYDISNPEQPVFENSYRWNLPTYDMQIYSNEYIVTANGRFGISILDLEAVTSIKNSFIKPSQCFISNYPNPFNPTTTINYQLSENSNVTLSVYNIKGQKVKTLISDQLTAGAHSVVWNGDDDSGKSVGSGIYFYKLKAGDFQKVKKMILLK
jgi:hypothetical protein